ncbi:MAG: FAD-binding protein [candidate division Zixibacteria bacterium]|nr:FAD-binding protein [candidate division Zixibacteria bacterium]
MLSKSDCDSLRKQLSNPDSLVLDPDHFEPYRHDATDETGEPAAIVFAESEEDVIASFSFCRDKEIPLIPRGAGTGLSGGCVPASGGLVLSTERMMKLDIDTKCSRAFCGPGVITKQLQDAVAEHGLAYPPDPASFEESTLGGNVAEGAGGLRCKRFGVTKDYIIGLRAITPDGSLLRTGLYGGGKGFALGDVLIASEGTLAVITEIAVRLIPASDVGTTLLVAFDHTQSAAQTVSDIIRTGLVPTVLEYIDGDAAACANEYEHSQELDNAAALLLIETNDLEREIQTNTIRHLCESNQCSYLRIETNHNKADSLWAVRRNISKAMKAMAVLRMSEDVAVPISRLPELVAFVRQMNTSSPLRINCYGHAGDGNLHINFMATEDSASFRRTMEQEIEHLLHKAIELGGTLTGEHGIGLTKRKYLESEFNAATLLSMKRIKDVFDPNQILNPGKIFP